MSGNEQLMDTCERVLTLVPANIEAQVTAQTSRSGLTRFANSYIHQNVAEDGHAVRLKVVVDGRVATAATNQTNDDSLRRLVESTVAAAKLRPADPNWPGMAPPAAAPNIAHFDDDTFAANPDHRATEVKRFVDAGPGLDGAGYCDSTGSVVAFANTAGQRLEGRSTRATIAGIHQTKTSEGAGSQTSSAIRDLEGDVAGELAASRARDSAEATDIEPGVYEVILEPDCVANMLQFLASSGFNSKAVAEERSFVHLGDQQFDEMINLWDDATDSRAVGLPFDNEGTPKRRLDLVIAGKTVGITHDRRTAAKAGTESTGHAGAESMGGVASNLFLDDSRGDDDLLGKVERGLIVSRFNYTRILDPKTQVVTGLTRSGVFLIEDGKIRSAVKNMRFTQSYVGALGPGKVKGIGSDAKLVGNYYVPSLHLAGWNFTGGARG